MSTEVGKTPLYKNWPESIYSNTINSKNITDYKASTTKDANQRLYDLNVHDKHDLLQVVN